MLDDEILKKDQSIIEEKFDWGGSYVKNIIKAIKKENVINPLDILFLNCPTSDERYIKLLFENINNSAPDTLILLLDGNHKSLIEKRFYFSQYLNINNEYFQLFAGSSYLI